MFICGWGYTRTSVTPGLVVQGMLPYCVQRAWHFISSGCWAPWHRQLCDSWQDQKRYCRGCKSYWDAQWCLQVQWLGAKEGGGVGWIWWHAYTLFQGPATGVYVVAGASCWHTHSSKGQHQYKELGSTVDVLAAVLTLAISVYSCGCRVLPQACTWQWRSVVGVGLQVHSCRG